MSTCTFIYLFIFFFFLRFEAYKITNSRIDMMKGHPKSDSTEGIKKVEKEVPREDEINLDFEMVACVPEAYHFEGLLGFSLSCAKSYDLGFWAISEYL